MGSGTSSCGIGTANPEYTNHWHTDCTCDCCNKQGGGDNVCFDVVFCPCCTLARHIDAVDGKANHLNWLICCLYGCIPCMTSVGCCLVRLEIKSLYTIYEDDCHTICIPLCCPCCAGCQHHRELTAHGRWPGRTCSARDPLPSTPSNTPPRAITTDDERNELHHHRVPYPTEPLAHHHHGSSVADVHSRWQCSFCETVNDGSAQACIECYGPHGAAVHPAVERASSLVFEEAAEQPKKKKEEQCQREPAAAAPPLSMCVVCLERPRNHIFVPCGHMCVCEPCGTSKSMKSCPMCRGKIAACLRVFVS